MNELNIFACKMILVSFLSVYLLLVCRLWPEGNLSICNYWAKITLLSSGRNKGWRQSPFCCKSLSIELHIRGGVWVDPQFHHQINNDLTWTSDQTNQKQSWTLSCCVPVQLMNRIEVQQSITANGFSHVTKWFLHTNSCMTSFCPDCVLRSQY